MIGTVHISLAESVFDCDSCANTIERVLRKTAGIERVRIEDAADRVEVAYDPALLEPDEITQIVDDWGYAPERIPSG